TSVAKIERSKAQTDSAAEIDTLVERLKHEDDGFVQWHIIRALEQVGPAAVPALTDALRDERSTVRAGAAEALGEIGGDAESGIPALTAALRDEDDQVRQSAAGALGEIGASTDAAIFALSEALSDKSSFMRWQAAKALERIGPAAAAAVPSLSRSLDDPDKDVRWRAAAAVRAIGPAAGGAVPSLARALESSDDDLRRAAAQALGAIGAEAKGTTGALIRALQDADHDVRTAAAEALGSIATALRDAEDSESLELLRIAQTALASHEDPAIRAFALPVRRATEYLEIARRGELAEAARWLKQHPYLLPLPTMILAWIGLCLLLFFVQPVALLRLNHGLRFLDLAPSTIDRRARLSLRTLLLVNYLCHQPRVLDAWIARRLAMARKNFQQRKTVQDRQVHVDVSVSLDGHLLNRLTAQDLQPIFERKLNHVLIQGEGGSGKTSLACQIGQWAMATSPAERVARQIMLPILIEDDLEADDHIDDPFIVTIQRRLQLLVDEESPIDGDMLRDLLLQRRLLVIVDHFSEMSEATRRLIRPDQSEFLANAMIITSRLEEDFGALTPVVVTPLRFSGSRLSSFIDAYLTMRRKRDLIEDTEFFDGCKKLSAMVGTREITVLLAKLYAEQMIGAKQKAQDSELPETIPGLMISYLNELNRNLTEHRIPDRALHKAAKTAAWACVRESFRPMPTSRQGLVEALGGDQGLLDYLEHRLHLMRTIPPAKEQVRFLLDPLAEYLAALHLVDLYGADAEAWRRLLVYAKVMPGGPDPIRSFLLAVRDCCLARGDAGPIPASVPGELWRLAGLRPVRRKLAAILAADMVG
ncbi:MAG TPA: HEAT repeat domain-containing protein, partial [Alphaproteobacteria bacterium]|nr:HEAT repeat domain-containing protein [Alphaproteobacteria bacterium]